MFRSVFSLLPLVCLLAVPAFAAEKIAVLEPMPPATAAAATNAVMDSLRAAHLTPTTISAADLARPEVFNATRFRVLVLPDATTFPALAQDNLLDFLRHKGNLVAVGAPGFQRYVYYRDHQWSSRQHIQQSLPTVAPLLNLANVDLKAWRRAADRDSAPLTTGIEPSPHGPALHLSFPHYKSWENTSPPPFVQSPFPPGSDLVSFWAKGDEHTPALVMEWREQDHSRWIGAVPLTPAWKRYVLSPHDFRFWEDGSPPDRGKAGDSFHPDQARELSIGLADSHAPMAPGPKQYWIADLAAATMPPGLPEVESPVLEGLSPWYKVYDQNDQMHPILRDRGVGIAGPHAGLLRIDPGGGWTYLAMEGPFSGATWSAINPLRGREGVRNLASLVGSVLNGLYLTAYGTSQFSAPPGETVEAGFDVTSTGPAASTLDGEIRITGPGNTSIRRATRIATGPGETKTFRFEWTPSAIGECRVETQLRRNGALVASGEHPFRVLPPANHSPAEMVQVHDGDFWLKGQPWRPVGINYWPLFVSGQELRQYRAGWLSPLRYDPELAERDLARCERLGINEVSIQYEDASAASSLNDFLSRCRDHGIKANLFLSAAGALHHNLAIPTRMIQEAHLAGNDAVFAYDIDWEPHLGPHPDRKGLDNRWIAWIDDQYGGVDQAEKEWGFPLPVEDGRPTNPLDSQLASDGPWRRMVAAYRRFAEDIISQGYGESRRAIRAADPNHLIGVRSGYGGNGNPWADSVMAYDLMAGGKNLDFVSPEGYALSGEWPEFRGGGFTTTYGRWAGNGKPVFWAEFGQSVFPNTTPARLQQQGDYYEKTFRMILDSGANGGSGWWFPGGLRVDENSDFGVISPDGTSRPAALAIQQYAARIKAQPLPPPPGEPLLIDRDRDARGYSAVWAGARSDYVRLREAGKSVNVRTAGTGTTTATMPLTAVGDVPANGHNPLEFANAEFNTVEHKTDASGDYLEVSVGNRGEATWLASGAGRVVLMISIPGAAPRFVPLAGPVPRYQDVTFRVSVALLDPAKPAAIRLAILDRPVSPGAELLIPFGAVYHWEPAASKQP